ncbi:rod shape-determining protein MreC [Patescibacteria group bacterium]
MRTSLLIRNNNSSKKIKIIAIIVVLILIALIYFFGGAITQSASNSTHGMFASVLKAGETTKGSVSIIPSFFSSRISLEKENEQLREKVREFEIENLVSESLRSENDELKKILDRLDYRKATLATIIARPNQSLYDTLIIDVGNEHGINKGDTVVAYGNVAIGRVEEIYNKSSKVVLFSSSGKRMEALVGENNLSATVIGRSGGNFEIRLSRDTEIKKGDIVSVPSMNIEILGTVAYIQKEPNDPFQSILIKSPVNIQELKWVEVIESQNTTTVEGEVVEGETEEE